MSLRCLAVTLTLGDGEQQVRALDGVNLDVGPGEFVAVVGPSGSGKSSLLAVCGGLRTPTSGQVVIGGADITGMAREALTDVRRERIGFVFQQSNLVPSLTALEQLLLTVHLRGERPDEAARRKALALLEEVGMADRSHRRPNQLSGGERQRVGIARALMGQPAVMLVDEPTSMLDHGRGEQIVELLARECHEHKVATLMVTHDPGMLGHADRVVRMMDGRLS
jgi:putative ABC transport system ATP-binding protein